MRITRMAVVLLSTLAVLSLLGGAGEAVAQTSPKLVANGMKIIFNPAYPEAFCTMGPVGTDSYGNRVGITAGHCLDGGDTYEGVLIPYGLAPIYDANDVAFGPIGYMRFIKPKALQPFLDYAILQFVEDVQLSAQGPHLKITGVLVVEGSRENLLGAAWFNNNELVTSAPSGTYYGRITNNSNGLYQCWAQHAAGDSGGPVIWHVPGSAYPSSSNNFQSEGPWAGITTRRSIAIPPYVYTSSANILKDLRLRDAASGFDGTVMGAGFQTTP